MIVIIILVQGANMNSNSHVTALASHNFTPLIGLLLEEEPGCSQSETESKERCFQIDTRMNVCKKKKAKVQETQDKV